MVRARGAQWLAAGCARRYLEETMCGRFTLRTPAEQLARHFDLPLLAGIGPLEPALEEGALRPRYNIAPSQTIAVIRWNAERGGRQWAQLRWGLVPYWADDPAIGHRLINARSESAATKPSFRRPFERGRCLIPADGFYEWRTMAGRKQPFYITRRDEQPFAFAGLWDRWKRDQQEVESCTILTTEANQLLRPLHERMPVILSPEEYAAWLDPAPQEPAELERLLDAYPVEALKLYPVGTRVNRPDFDAAECIAEVEVTEGEGSREEDQPPSRARKSPLGSSGATRKPRKPPTDDPRQGRLDWGE